MRRILLVDDESLIRRLAGRMLEEAGFNVLQAENGLAALDIIRELNGAIDLLITDLVMPRMTGTELAERVRAEYPEVKILCISGYAHEAVPQGCAFLSKPFTRSVLVGTIQKLCGGAAGVDASRGDDLDLRLRLSAATAKLKAANKEYRRLTEMSSDVVNGQSDGRLALRQAMALKQTALSEYMKAYREWTQFTAEASPRQGTDQSSDRST